jgi:hypothetical protein
VIILRSDEFYRSDYRISTGNCDSDDVFHYIKDKRSFAFERTRLIHFAAFTDFSGEMLFLLSVVLIKRKIS